MAGPGRGGTRCILHQTCVNSSGTPAHAPEPPGPTCGPQTEGRPQTRRVFPRNPREPSPAITLLQPAPTPEQRAMRVWGQTGSRPGFHVERPEQKHPAPGGRNPTGLRRLAGASGRAAGRGSHCSEEERSPADMTAPAARLALARPRWDGSHLNMDRPTAEAPAPEPPDTVVPLVSHAPARRAHGCERGGRHTQARASRVLPGVRGGTRSRDRPTPTTRSGTGHRAAETCRAAGHRAHPREPWPCSPRGRGATATWTPGPAGGPTTGGVSPTPGSSGWGRAPTEGIKQGHTVPKEALVRAPSCPRAPGH